MADRVLVLRPQIRTGTFTINGFTMNFRLSVTAQSTWKKSTASMVAAWVRRNCRHVVSVCLDGAGDILRSLRILRMVDAPTRCPSLSSSPWILL
jgi:hypothetical protein